MCVWASRKVGRPIKWTAERMESFATDAHGRDHFTRAELALDKDGKFLAMRVKTAASMGAYLSTFASCIPTILYATLLAGQYTTPAIHCEVTAVFTNTAPVDAYRGAGRPEATYVVERLVATAAKEMNIAQDEIRRRNFIRQFPYATPVALTYDTGDYDACLDGAMEMAGVAGFAGRDLRSRSIASNATLVWAPNGTMRSRSPLPRTRSVRPPQSRCDRSIPSASDSRSPEP